MKLQGRMEVDAIFHNKGLAKELSAFAINSRPRFNRAEPCIELNAGRFVGRKLRERERRRLRWRVAYVCAAQPTALARACTLRLTVGMKGRAAFVLLGLGILAGYALGDHSTSVGHAPNVATPSPSGVARLPALSGPA